MAQSPQSFVRGLELLADYLENKQEDILENWSKILQEEGQQISNLASLSHEKFYDHIPVFLDLLCQNFRQKKISAEGIARKHGTERWEHGIDLRETTTEWARLHQVLMIQINLSKDTLSLSYEVLEEAQKRTANMIHDGIINSVNKYYLIQNRKAEAQMRDLEEVLKKEKENRENQNEQLQQTTHDLKGILYSLRSGFNLLEDEDFEGRKSEIIKEMSLATDSLNRLLNNLLELFRLEAGREEVDLTSVNVNEVMENLCESLQPLAQSNGLKLRCEGNDLSVKTDRMKLERITQNLVVNALRYTQVGYIEVNWQLKDDSWELQVCDTGPGLSKKDGQLQGEGIGLLIVRQLCKLFDAIIDIESEPDTGTTFRIIFPLENS